jgi:hypothetical protein
MVTCAPQNEIMIYLKIKITKLSYLANRLMCMMCGRAFTLSAKPVV